jgi:hypothetical protein
MDERRYVCYMLRLWRTGGGPESPWRYSLEEVRSGERRGFASLEALCDYLQGVMGGPGASVAQPPGER